MVRGPSNLLAAVVLGLLVVAAGCGGHRAAAPQLEGLLLNPLPHKPSFTLTDTAGRPFRFAAATRGKLTYLYFGYTHCPDACPATMSDIAYALRLQPAAFRKRIAVVFVTVDPRRDTRRVLRAWLDHYGRSFVGLRGSDAQVAAAERAAGVPLAPPERQRGARYAVQHASIVLAFSSDNLAHVIYTQGFKPGAYAHDMPLLLAH